MSALDPCRGFGAQLTCARLSHRRTSTSVASEARAGAKPAPTRNARWKPSVSADAGAARPRPPPAIPDLR